MNSPKEPKIGRYVLPTLGKEPFSKRLAALLSSATPVDLIKNIIERTTGTSINEIFASSFGLGSRVVPFLALGNGYSFSLFLLMTSNIFYLMFATQNQKMKRELLNKVIKNYIEGDLSRGYIGYPSDEGKFGSRKIVEKTEINYALLYHFFKIAKAFSYQKFGYDNYKNQVGLFTEITERGMIEAIADKVKPVAQGLISKHIKKSLKFMHSNPQGDPSVLNEIRPLVRQFRDRSDKKIYPHRHEYISAIYGIVFYDFVESVFPKVQAFYKLECNKSNDLDALCRATIEDLIQAFETDNHISGSLTKICTDFEKAYRDYDMLQPHILLEVIKMKKNYQYFYENLLLLSRKSDKTYEEFFLKGKRISDPDKTIRDFINRQVSDASLRANLSLMGAASGGQGVLQGLEIIEKDGGISYCIGGGVGLTVASTIARHIRQKHEHLGWNKESQMLGIYTCFSLGPYLLNIYPLMGRLFLALGNILFSQHAKSLGMKYTEYTQYISAGLGIILALSR